MCNCNAPVLCICAVHISTHRLSYSLNQHLCSSTVKSGDALASRAQYLVAEHCWQLHSAKYWSVGFITYIDINHLLVFTWSAVWEGFWGCFWAQWQSTAVFYNHDWECGQADRCYWHPIQYLLVIFTLYHMTF